MAIKKPSARQFGWFARKMQTLARSTPGRMIGRTVMSDTGWKLGQRVLKKTATAIGIGAKDGKKNWGKGLQVLASETLGASVKLATAKPQFSKEQLYRGYVKDFRFRHGKDQTKWSAKAKRDFQSFEKFKEKHIAGIDYRETPAEMERRAKMMGTLTKGTLGVGGLTGVAFQADKLNGMGFVETRRGTRIEGGSRAMSLKNPEGKGSRLDAGFKIKHKGAAIIDTGGTFAMGHAQRAGWAHQLGAHVKVNTPLVKTGIELGEQHAFGTKQRSRRVSAIKRLVFGKEQFLGATAAKPNRKAKKLDYL